MDLNKMRKALLEYSKMTKELQDALLLDTCMTVSVRVYKTPNRRRISKRDNARRRAKKHSSYTLEEILNFAKSAKSFKTWGGYVVKTVRGKTYPMHHLVWMEANNRFVPKGYDIHHKNGVRDDNRIENLELVNASTHRREHNKACD